MTFLKKILLLDQHSHCTAMMREALESTGRYIVRLEHDSRRAAGAVQWFRPDLILCEVPGRCAELVRELQARSCEAPVVYVHTAGGASGVASDGTLGGYTFSAEPLEPELLLDYVEELLS